MMRTDRTVSPKGPCGTGQPCELTQNVLPTPKSWLDCITAGESPSGSSLRITCAQVAPAPTRYMGADSGGGLVDLDGTSRERHRHAVARNALSAHGVARDAERERSPLRRRVLQLAPQSFDERIRRAR